MLTNVGRLKWCEDEWNQTLLYDEEIQVLDRFGEVYPGLEAFLKIEDFEFMFSYQERNGNIGKVSHHNWNGGVSSENTKARGVSRYRTWRNSIFKRDDYTCQCCGKRGGELNAHHIENFSDNEELRYDVDNGITLCKNCHSHSIKGSFHYIW